MEIKLVFSVEDFLFSKFHETEAKQDRHNFKRGLTLTFKAKNLQNYCKNWL